MTEQTPDTPTDHRPSRASRLRSITRILVVVVLIGTLLFAAPAVAQSQTETEEGGGGGEVADPSNVDSGEICSSGPGQIISLGMFLMMIFGVAIGLLMLQWNSIKRMFGQQSAEIAAQQAANVKRGIAGAVGIPMVAAFVAGLVGFPVIGCLLNGLPLV
jgi:hypothetical protein